MFPEERLEHHDPGRLEKDGDDPDPDAGQEESAVGPRIGSADRDHQHGGQDQADPGRLEPCHPLADEDHREDDDEGGVGAIDDGHELGPEPVEGLEEKRVRDGDADDAAQEEPDCLSGRKIGAEPLAEEEHGRDDEDDGQDVLEEVHPERMDLLSGDAEEDDRDGPQDGGYDGQDLAQTGKRLGGAEDIVHGAVGALTS